MKKKADRDLIILIILIPIFLLGAFFISSRAGNMLPAYSVMNKSYTGYSMFLEALKELDYPVSRALTPINEADTDTIQMVVENKNFDVNREENIAWVEDGGTLIYLISDGMQPILTDVTPETTESFSIYRYGGGRIIEMEAANLTNRALIKDTGSAYALVEEFNRLPAYEIAFNESYMYSALDQKSLWSQTPLEIKFIIYHLIIVLAAWFYFKGKRFGKAVPLYEESERSENEYLYSVASLYRHAGCHDLILEDYYRHFLWELKCTHDNWLEYWERENYPDLNLAREVYEFMHHHPEKSIRPKKYIQITTMLEQLGKYTVSSRLFAVRRRNTS